MVTSIVEKNNFAGADIDTVMLVFSGSQTDAGDMIGWGFRVF